MYCEIMFFVYCLPRRSLCVSETLNFHEKDILKYLCLNFSHVSSCSFHECDSCVCVCVCVCACARTRVCKQVYMCVCSMFSNENKKQWERPNVSEQKENGIAAVFAWHM